MKKVYLFAIPFLIASCSNDEDKGINFNYPDNYEFTRNNESSVSYSGQTTRIAMAEEIISALKNTEKSATEIKNMFGHQKDAEDFSDANLNASDKSVRSKTAASNDYYSANTTDASSIKSEFDGWIDTQVDEVYPKWDNDASKGNAGQLQQLDGTVRYIDARGLELNQMFNKSLIGALIVDQIANNYLSASVLDAGDNKANNSAGVLASGKKYTTMEHKWDEAFGYLYGAESDATSPLLGKDSFLNKYLKKVDSDEDFSGIAADIYRAFVIGRAAIVAKDYNERDRQADIIREKISEVVGIRAVYYLEYGKNMTDKAKAFHALSEGVGFIYSLQFTRKPGTDAPYFSKNEVDEMLNELLKNDGFWDVTEETLDSLSEKIAGAFNFTVEQAKS